MQRYLSQRIVLMGHKIFAGAATAMGGLDFRLAASRRPVTRTDPGFHAA
jgi:hypothetical protein